MAGRVAVFGAFVAFIAALAVYATLSGPAGNDIVYGHWMDVEVSVGEVDPGFQVAVAGVTSRQLSEVELWTQGTAAAVVVTVTPTGDESATQFTIDPDATTLSGGDASGEYEVRPSPVRAGEIFRAGVPTVVLLDLTQPVELAVGHIVQYPATPSGPVEVTVPLLADGAQIATVIAVLTPIAQTGDDYGIAGTVDIPDQRLPRPKVGEALPAQLDDGRPVWVIGLDDTVAGLDARSPHRYSGLVGWCGSMPGFIDSIGSSRFTATGEYRFGPSPNGLVPYAVEVAGDHVTVTHRLPRPPLPPASDYVGPFPQIEGSTVEQGPVCDIDHETAVQAYADDAFLEDYRGNPTWVQHDLADWPSLDGAVGDGWFRTDEHDLADDGPHLVGDLLVHRQRGVFIDAASPPGTARTLYPSRSEPFTATGRLVQFDRPDEGPGAVLVEPVMWVTPSGIAIADSPPADRSRQLVATGPSSTYQLTGDIEVDASPGDVITITIVDQHVTNIAIPSGN